MSLQGIKDVMLMPSWILPTHKNHTKPNVFQCFRNVSLMASEAPFEASWEHFWNPLGRILAILVPKVAPGAHLEPQETQQN
jgi:hypothetical protein